MRQTARIDPTRLDWRGWICLEKRVGYEHWVKPEGDKIHNRELYDDAIAVREAQMRRETQQARRGNTQEMWRQQMVIPESLRARAIIEGWSDDMDRWRKLARDSDYRAFRTTDERV